MNNNNLIPMNSNYAKKAKQYVSNYYNANIYKKC